MGWSDYLGKQRHGECLRSNTDAWWIVGFIVHIVCICLDTVVKILSILEQTHCTGYFDSEKSEKIYVLTDEMEIHFVKEIINRFLLALVHFFSQL